jgi:hypothetical protein
MDVKVDPANHRVLLNTDQGGQITLSWSGALLLGTLLREASLDAEPQPKGKTFSTSVSRWG